jgi:metallophosphoesterase superfamily enzyme
MGINSIADLIETSKLKQFTKAPRKEKQTRVLVIGDLHEPFSLDEYFDHCCQTYNQYDCNTVVFIGDIIDNHYSGYHDADPDGMSAGKELEVASQRIAKWYKMFPKATVVTGNHDRMAIRKAFSGGLSNRWIKGFNEILGTPKWKFVEEVKIDDVVYCHGEGKKARLRVKDELCSIVQGHYHSEAYIEFMVGSNYKVFGMQVGCGIDRKAYAMNYGQHFKKPVISCGIIIGGKKAYLEMMEL